MRSSDIIKKALAEDVGGGDITTKLLFPEPIRIRAKIIAKQDGVVCGIAVVEKVFKLLDTKLRFNKKVKDGRRVKKGETICAIEGDARAILTGERTALNFLSHLSGIATLTRKYVGKVKPYKVKILDTRKTTPGLRVLEKYAVKCGGGTNHRMGLWDGVLIKDNHIVVVSRQSSVVSIKNLVTNVRKKTNKKIEIEIENLKQFKEALAAGPDVIMLDNMTIADIKKAVALRNKLTTKLEVSGGVTLKNVRAIAKTGVDMISIGALTHSAKAMDFSLEVI